MDQEIEDGLRRMCEPLGIGLALHMSSLPDGALDAGQTPLDAKARHRTVVIQNSGHRPVRP